MSKPSLMPSGREVAREALIVIGGAVLAAVIVNLIPGLREWIKAQWAAQDPGTR